MAVRLIEMRRVLRQNGSLYLHCDPTASHYLKQLLDAIFSKYNFRNEIVWSYQGTANPKTHFKRKHDYLLFYTKNKDKAFFSDEGSSESISKFSKSKYTKRDHQGWYKEIRHPDGRVHKQYRRDAQRMRDVWEIPVVNAMAKERAGYPTQKPLALYERILRASSNEDDIVLDPFCGCGTTLVAAERLGRQWVGIDIWNATLDVVIDRLKKENLTPNDEESTCLWADHMHYRKDLPERTDDQQEAALSLKTIKRGDEPKGRKMSRAEMLKELLDRHGNKCLGCDRQFDDSRYLELDHNTPRSDGGLNHISNRVLLCGPCNKLKSNQYTLASLRHENRRLGYMGSSS